MCCFINYNSIIIKVNYIPRGSYMSIYLFAFTSFRFAQNIVTYSSKVENKIIGCGGHSVDTAVIMQEMF